MVAEGKDGGRDSQGVWDGQVHTARCYVAAWMGGGFDGERIHIYVWLSLFAVHLNLLQHC